MRAFYYPRSMTTDWIKLRGSHTRHDGTGRDGTGYCRTSLPGPVKRATLIHFVATRDYSLLSATTFRNLQQPKFNSFAAMLQNKFPFFVSRSVPTFMLNPAEERCFVSHHRFSFVSRKQLLKRQHFNFWKGLTRSLSI